MSGEKDMSEKKFMDRAIPLEVPEPLYDYLRLLEERLVKLEDMIEVLAALLNV